MTLKQVIQATGFSENVADLAAQSQRGSTRSVYQSRFTKFDNWCNRKSISSRAPAKNDVAEFLIELARVEKLSLSTIKGYRTAIAETIGVVNETNFGNDPILTKLIKGLANECLDKLTESQTGIWR